MERVFARLAPRKNLRVWLREDADRATSTLSTRLHAVKAIRLPVW